MGTDLPFLVGGPSSTICGLHQVLCVAECDGSILFPPVLHLLMAKLDLNAGVAHGNGRVLFLYQGYGMGCLSWRIINPLCLSLSCPPVGPHRMDTVMDDRFQIASSTKGGRSTGRLRLVRLVSCYLPGSGQCCVCSCHGKKRERRLFTRGRTSPPSPSACRPVFLWRGSQFGPQTSLSP